MKIQITTTSGSRLFESSPLFERGEAEASLLSSLKDKGVSDELFELDVQASYKLHANPIFGSRYDTTALTRFAIEAQKQIEVLGQIARAAYRRSLV